MGSVFNDAKRDPEGRLWIGARPALAVRAADPVFLGARSRAPLCAAALWGPNGLACIVSGDRFFLADSASG